MPPRDPPAATTIAHWQAARSLVPAAAVLAFFYFCGLDFYQENLNAWGFDASLFPINTQEVYVQALVAMVALGNMLMERIAQAIGWLIVAAVALIVIDAIPTRRLLATLRQTRVGRLVQDWSTPTNRRTPLMTGVGNLVIGVLAIAGGLLVVLGLSAVLSSAAHRTAQRAWDQQAFATWPTITWTESNGAVVAGHLKTCSDKWCAVIQENRARVVAVIQVKNIEKIAPVSSGKL